MLRAALLAIAGSALLSASALAATPAFSVHKNGTNQTVAQDTDVKLTWPTEGFDTNNNFATDRFTPTVSGKYLIVVSTHCQQAGVCMPAIYKNGSGVARSQVTERTVGQTPHVTAILDMNGSTDYVEAFVNAGSSIITGFPDRTYFTGSLIDSGGSSVAAGSTGQVQFNQGGNLHAVADLFWESTNERLGIGTANPGSTAEVYGSGQSTAALTDAGNRGGMLMVTDSGNAAGAGGAIIFRSQHGVSAGSLGYGAIKGLLTNGGGNSIGGLAFSTRGLTSDTALSERVRITSDGNVGIGTTSPASKLHVEASSTIAPLVYINNTGGSGASSAAVFRGGANNATVVNFQVQDASGNGDLTVTGDGNVGIGTSSPGTARLNVVGSTADNSAYGLIVQNSSSTPIMYVRNDGNVGIGTTNPGNKLDVGGVGNSSTIRVNRFTLYDDNSNAGMANNNAGAFLIYNNVGTSGAATAYRLHATSSGTAVLDILNNGNVGIGTPGPSQKLSVLGSSGAPAVGNSGSGLAWFVENTGNNGLNIGANYNGGAPYSWLQSQVATGTAAYYPLILNSLGGNVGIGTTSTSYRLHVAGQVAGNAAYVNTSDARLKTDVQDLDYGLDTVMQLRAVSFRWKAQKENWQKGRKIGLVAQEAETVLPEIVSTATDAMHTKSIAYGDLTPVLIRAVQELKAANDNLRSELREAINSQDQEIEVLRQEIEALRAAQ